jgi:hypothetical protein
MLIFELISNPPTLPAVASDARGIKCKQICNKEFTVVWYDIQSIKFSSAHLIIHVLYLHDNLLVSYETHEIHLHNQQRKALLMVSYKPANR